MILAHKDLEQVVKLCEKISPYFEIYIHIDKSTFINNEIKTELTNMNVHWWSVYNVKWGSYNIVLATVMLMKEALKDDQNSYFHLISGQDWPLQDPLTIFNNFVNDQNIYMDYFKAKNTFKAGENLIWWVKYYFNYNQINRRSLFGKIYHRLILLIQRMIRIDKLKKNHLDSDAIYAGQEWVDIPRDALSYAIKEFDSNKAIQRVFETSFCSDEMWLQTILCNSNFKDRINKDIHRYINWTEKNGSYPAILDEEDFDKIKNGDYWWGRKISMPISNELIKRLEIIE